MGNFAPALQQNTGESARVLIIDDCETTRYLFERHVEAEGHVVDTADDGDIGLEKLRKNEYDLVLLDIVMPRLDGYEVLRQIQDDQNLIEIPVIVISSVGEMESVIQCIDLGAVDYMPKDVDRALLRSRISACLEKKWRRDWQQKHIKELLQAMTKIENGEMSIQLQIPNDDLYGSLFRGFNLMTKGLKEAASILEIAQELSAEMQLDVLLERIMLATTQLLQADRSTLYIYDKRDESLWSLVAEGLNRSELRIPADKGVAGLAFTSGEVVNIPDPYNHPAFNPEFDRQTGYKTESILCMPILNKIGKRIGVTQVLNKHDGHFTDKDVDRLKAFTSQIAVSLDNAQLFNDIMKIKNYNESILKCTSNGLITFDTDRNFVTVNAAAEKILNVDPKKLVGTCADEFFVDHNRWIVESVAKVEEQGVEDTTFQGELRFGDGKTISMNTTVVPLADAEGVTIGSMLMIEDITDEKRIKATMARYMSKEVADQLLEKGDVELGGQLQKVTILFSDLRKFTSVSEVLGPTATVDLLNEYFSEMVDIIFRHHGILDKYIGDAIMALFGAPLSRNDDADNALRVANEMQRAVQAMNRRRAKLDVPPIEMGLGISTGMVIAGNIGSPKRMEYTVIGDSVNLASRLESANKFYDTRILLSDFTVKEMQPGAKLREIDLIRVKGKKEPVAVYEALAFYDEESFPNQEQVTQIYAEGLKLYRHREWSKARQAFTSVSALRPGDRPAAIHLSRCDEFSRNPPPDTWDGVWQMLEK